MHRVLHAILIKHLMVLLADQLPLNSLFVSISSHGCYGTIWYTTCVQLDRSEELFFFFLLSTLYYPASTFTLTTNVQFDRCALLAWICSSFFSTCCWFTTGGSSSLRSGCLSTSPFLVYTKREDVYNHYGHVERLDKLYSHFAKINIQHAGRGGPAYKYSLRWSCLFRKGNSVD